MLTLLKTNRKWRKLRFVDGFHGLTEDVPVYSMSMAALYHTGITVNFCGAGKNFCGSEAQYIPKIRYATVVVKVHAVKPAEWTHTLMIGKESLKGWWILTTLKKLKNFEKNFFEKWSEIVSTHLTYLFHLPCIDQSVLFVLIRFFQLRVECISSFLELPSSEFCVSCFIFTFRAISSFILIIKTKRSKRWQRRRRRRIF